jgi:transposase
MAMKNNAKEHDIIISTVSDFLESDTPYLIKWVMVFFLLFCGFSQKTVGTATGYTERQVRNIQNKFYDFDQNPLQINTKKGRKNKITPEMHGEIVKYIITNPDAELSDMECLLKEKYGVTLSSVTIEKELKKYNLSDISKVVKKTKSICSIHNLVVAGSYPLLSPIY